MKYLDKEELLFWLYSIYDCLSADTSLTLMEEIIIRIKNGVFDVDEESNNKD